MISSFSVAQELQQKHVIIHFDSDKSALTEQHKSKIRKAIIDLGFGSIKDIYIEGHTDSDDTEAYNIILSQRRSTSVESYLLKQGVNETMLHTESFGESYPLSEVKSQNRRCVISLVYVIWTNLPQDPVAVRVKVIDAISEKPIPCSYTIEQRDKIIPGRTNKLGISSFKYDPSYLKAELITSARGYLNERAVLLEKRPNASTDSFDLVIRMHRVRVIQKLSFKNIYFHTDTDSLKKESEPELKRLLTTLQKFSKMYVEIQGHMNYPTSRPMNAIQRVYNYNLSYKRAKKIYNYLIASGVDQERLTYKGMSNRAMIYKDPQNKAQQDANKRVEVWTLQKIKPN